MKVVAYSIQAFEKEFLIKANQKKHDITLISNALTEETAGFAAGKDAVIVFTDDNVSENIIEKLASFGVRFITTRSVATNHIDKLAAAANGLKVANVPFASLQATHQDYPTPEALQEIAGQTIRNLDLWQLEKCVGSACVCAKNCRVVTKDAVSKI